MDGVAKELSEIAMHTSFGVVGGIVANRAARSVDDGTNDPTALGETILKLLIIAGVLMFIERQIPGVVADWQSTVPGLFFVSFFFGLQTNIISHLVALRNHYLRGQ